MYRRLARILKNWSFTEVEKEIISRTKAQSSNKSDKIILIQSPKDLYWFEKIEEITTHYKDYIIQGVVPKTKYKKIQNIILFPLEILSRINDLVLNYKWAKIYNSLGIREFYGPKYFKKKTTFENFVLACKNFKKLNSKETLLSHKFKGIKCGDLIYDSFIRFNKKPTVDINDLNLIFYLTDCYNHICYFTDLAKEKKIEAYFSTYSTYIAHGIPIRVFLNLGIKIFTFGYFRVKNFNFQLKELNKFDTTQAKPFWNFKKIFDSLEEKDKFSSIGYNEFGKRFKGLNDLSYMKFNQYSKKYESDKLEYNLDGVVFIGDFFDSQHIYGSMVFNDLFEWLIYTIELVKQYDLKIGFKPHPNQLEGSSKMINKIKKDYNGLIWIDSKVSNNIIFKSGIKFGISVYGSVLQELAYHEILPISCADNPTSSFGFVFQAKTKSEYENLILNYNNLKQPKDIKKQIGAFYYIYHLYKKFQYDLN